MLRQHIAKIGAVSIIVAALSACAAMNTAITHRHLDVQTKMNPTVFLPPAEIHDKTVYVDVHNTSGKSGINLTSPIKASLKSKGYRILTSPSKAHYLLQVNIRQLGKSSQSAAQQAYGGGYGSALSGAALGVGVAAATGGNGSSMIAGGVLGGIGSSVIDDVVTDTTYTLITDIQITTKLPKGEKGTSSTTSETRSGSGTQTVTHISGAANTIQYRTRVVSIADKVDLSFDTAKPALIKELASSISNIF